MVDTTLYLDKIAGLCLMDDEFMTRVFDGNIKAVSLVLEIIIDKPLEVKEVNVQKIVKNLYGKEIWLDVYAVNADGVAYNIEIQRTDKGAGFKRARYHSSLMDCDALPKGSDTSAENLPEHYVIFITQNDVIGYGLPIYHIERMVMETRQEIDDDEHIIYVNGAYDDVTDALGKLIHDLKCKEPENMYYKELADEVYYYKRNAKGVQIMSGVFEEAKREWQQEARIEGQKEGRKEGRKVGHSEGLQEKAKEFFDYLISKGETKENALAISGYKPA